MGRVHLPVPARAGGSATPAPAAALSASGKCARLRAAEGAERDHYRAASAGPTLARAAALTHPAGCAQLAQTLLPAYPPSAVPVRRPVRHWRIQPPVLGGTNLGRGPNIGYPQNWKLHGFNPLFLFFLMDPNSLSKKIKRKRKSFWELFGGQKTWWPPLPGLWGAWPGWPPGSASAVRGPDWTPGGSANRGGPGLRVKWRLPQEGIRCSSGGGGDESKPGVSRDGPPGVLRHRQHSKHAPKRRRGLGGHRRRRLVYKTFAGVMALVPYATQPCVGSRIRTTVAVRLPRDSRPHDELVLPSPCCPRLQRCRRLAPDSSGIDHKSSITLHLQLIW